MTSDNINTYVDGVRKDKKNTVRIKGSQKHPTRSLSFNNSRGSYYPYMEVDHGKQTDFYEFEKTFKKTNLPEQISKWILFSIHAKRNAGKFYLVVDTKSKTQYDKIVREKKLDIEVITIK